ncbi:MAG: hypothetical protein KC543_12445 [Myxococcales bacterium]|nr:hypothetical protein [Myxococcales bacterium]
MRTALKAQTLAALVAAALLCFGAPLALADAPASLLAGVTAAEAPQVAARLGDRIVSGSEAAAESKVEWGTAIGVVDRPFDEVVKVVQDYQHYATFLPHFKTSRVLAQRGARALVYIEVGIIKDTATLWGQFNMSAETNGAARVVEAHMQRGNLDHFVARFEVTPLDGGARALVRFRILVDPGLPLPSSVFTNENVKAARKTIAALRVRVAETS